MPKSTLWLSLLLLATRYSLLATRYSLLATRYSLGGGGLPHVRWNHAHGELRGGLPGERRSLEILRGHL